MKIHYSQWKRDKQIAVNSLRFDPENPRLRDVIGSEKAVIEALAEDEDLEELLKKIIDYGMAPVERLVAIYDGKKYIVVEGNRRLAVFKMLLAPEKVPKNLANLVKRAKDSLGAHEIPKRVGCDLPLDHAEARVYAYMKHAAEKFSKKWAPIQQAVFITREAVKMDQGEVPVNDFTPAQIKDARSMVQLYRLAGVISRNPKSKIDGSKLREFPFEAVRRMFLSSEISKIIGLSFDSEGITVRGGIEQFSALFEKVLQAMTTGPATRTFNTVNDIKTWLTKNSYKPPVGTTKQRLSEFLDKGVAATQPDDPPPRKTDPKPKKKAKKRTVLLFDPPLEGPHLSGRAAAIVDELEAAVPIEEHLNSIGVMLRVLFEMTLKDSLKRHHEWGHLCGSCAIKAIGPSLREILTYIDGGTSKIQLEPNEAVALRQLFKNKTSLLSVATMNQYIHNADFPPDFTGVRSLAAKMRPILQRCFQ